MIENKFISESSEIAFLNCIIKDENCLLSAIEFFKKNSLGNEYCNSIYNTILDILEEGNKLLPELLISRLDEDTNKYLEIVKKHKADISNFEYYTKIVKDKYLFRSYNKLSNTIKSDVQTIEKTEDLVQHIQDKIDEINISTPNQTVSFGQNLFDIIPDPMSMDESHQGKILGISSGIKTLDDIVLGFHPGCMTTIAGRPNESKSLVTRSILLHNALKGIPILLFSMDENEQLVKLKTISTITQIDYNHLKKQELTKGEMNVLRENLELFKSLPFFIDTTPFLTVSLIRARIKKLLYKHKNLGAVAIDYVQQMGVTTEDITRVSQGIKNLCQEFKIPFFVISQLSRNIENRTIENNESWTTPPLLSDLRQSGSLEQDSDKIIFVRSEPAKSENNTFKEKRKCRIFVSKQRDNVSGLWFDMYSIGKIQTLEEINNKKSVEQLPF